MMKHLIKLAIIALLVSLTVGCNDQGEKYVKYEGVTKENIPCFKRVGIEYEERADGIYIKEEDVDKFEWSCT